MDQEQDDFADFRKSLAGLGGAERKAQLKAMEDAILENWRTQVVPDLYVDEVEQGPAPAPKQPTGRGPVAPTNGWTPEPVYTNSALYNEKAGEDIWEFIDDDSNGYGAFEEANGRADDPTTNEAYWGQPGVRQKFEKFREERLKKHNLQRMPKGAMDGYGSPKSGASAAPFKSVIDDEEEAVDPAALMMTAGPAGAPAAQAMQAQRGTPRGTYKPPFGRGGDAEGERPDWTQDYPFSLYGPDDDIVAWFDEKFGNAPPETIQQAISDLSAEIQQAKDDGDYGGDTDMMKSDVLRRLQEKAAASAPKRKPMSMMGPAR